MGADPKTQNRFFRYLICNHYLSFG